MNAIGETRRSEETAARCCGRAMTPLGNVAAMCGAYKVVSQTFLCGKCGILSARPVRHERSGGTVLRTRE